MIEQKVDYAFQSWNGNKGFGNATPACVKDDRANREIL
jgi:hypothetical protein